jgi:hypothetical protein
MSATAGIKSHFDAHVNAAPWRNQGFRGIMSVAGRIIDAARAWLVDQLKRTVDTKEERDAIKNAALEYFDGLDLPVVDGVQEASLKSFIRPSLEALIDQALAAVT